MEKKPSLFDYIQNFFSYRALLVALTKKDVRLKYRRSYLGVLWSLLNPLFTMMVMTIVFSTLFKRNIDNFPVYLLTGKLIFDFNAQSTRSAMTSIVSNSALIRKIYIPKYIFPLSQVFSNCVNLFFSFIALILVMLATHASFYPTLFLAWIPLLYLLVFSMGLSLFLSAVNVFFRDAFYLYSVILTAWTYFTPVFYPAEIIPEKYMIVLKLNPLYHMVSIFRSIVMNGSLCNLRKHVICIIYAVLMLTIGVIVFKKKQDQFILFI